MNKLIVWLLMLPALAAKNAITKYIRLGMGNPEFADFYRDKARQEVLKVSEYLQ